MTDFKSQLESLVNEAAVKYSGKGLIGDWSMQGNFKQGCEFLMPVLMKAVEELDKSEKELGIAFSVDESDIDARLENLKKELLNILKY